MSTMKAAVLRGKLDLSVEEVPVPQIGAGDILLKVRAASICGTDVRMYKNGRANIDAEHPRIIGHEFAGVIEQVGEGVTGYTVGQHVSVAPNIGCGTCDPCITGQTNACPDYQGFGIHIDGGFAEYVRVPAAAVAKGNVRVLDDETSFAEAALVEPLACVYNGQTRMGLTPGADVLLIGAGPIGIMHAKLAYLRGAARVFVNDLSQERMDQIAELVPGVIPVSGDIAAEIRRHTGDGVDGCIIAAPAPSAQTESLGYMNMNGKVLFFGGLPKDRENVMLNTNILHYRQLTIVGCTGQSLSDYRACAKLVDAGRISLKEIISDRYAIDEFPQAMEAAASAQGLKHVIEFA